MHYVLPGEIETDTPVHLSLVKCANGDVTLWAKVGKTSGEILTIKLNGKLTRHPVRGKVAAAMGWTPKGYVIDVEDSFSKE